MFDKSVSKLQKKVQTMQILNLKTINKL